MKRSLVQIVVCLSLITALGASRAHSFIFKKPAPKKQSQEKPKQIVPKRNEKLDSLTEEVKRLKARIKDLEEKNNIVTGDYKKLIQDRDNLLTQTRRLVKENKKLAGLKESLEKTKEEEEKITNTFTAQIETKEKENKRLTGEIRLLQADVDKANAQRADLEKVLLRLQKVSQPVKKEKKDRALIKLKKQEKQLSLLKKENVNLLDELKRAAKRAEILEASKAKIKEVMEDLQARLEALQKRHARVEKEKEVLTEEAREFPKKFADMARQNKALIKEMADTHYNLGVFYTKEREYKRAVKEFDKVLDIRPTDANSYYNLGFIYAEHIVERRKAIRNFKDYLRYAPDARDADWVKKYILTWQAVQGKKSPK